MTSGNRNLTQVRLKQLLRYDHLTGEFVWKVRRSNVAAGTVAGGFCRHPRGYVLIGIDGTKYLAHRLVWLYVHGSWPSEELDHIDGDTSNNRLANLRECNRALNSQNTVRDLGRTSKHPGVYWDAARGGGLCGFALAMVVVFSSAALTTSGRQPMSTCVRVRSITPSRQTGPSSVWEPGRIRMDF